MRSKRLVINLLLLGGLLALVAVLWFSHGAPEPTPSLPRVSEIPPQAIQRIEVHAAGDLILLQREPGGGWQIEQPVKARPDAPHLQAILELAGARATQRYPLNAIAADITGLARPLLALRFNEAPPVQVGAPGPTQGSRYIGTAHALLIAPAARLEGLDLAWNHWIDPAIIAPGRQLTRLVLPDFTLTRDQHKNWHAVPVGKRSAAAAAATVQAWQHLAALDVEPSNLVRARIARITLQFADGGTRQLDLMERAPDLTLRDTRLGVDYLLAGNRVAPLLDLRHPGLTDASGPDARSHPQMATHPDR